MTNGRVKIILYSLLLLGGPFLFLQCSKVETPQEVVKSAPPVADARKTPVVRAVERALPSIVDISAESSAVYKGKPAVALRPGTNQFYLIQPVRGVKASRNGAGVVVDRKGFIVTNAHVVEGLDRVIVSFSDDKNVPGEIYGIDTQEDLAVIKIDPPYPLQPIIFADSDYLMVGETAVAIGNPFGLGQSVSSGVVSATKRDIIWKNTNAVYHDLVQTDISLNVGNSGGPLLNIRGELIGLNLAEATGAEGISFAIPSKRVKSVYEKIRDKKLPEKSEKA